MKIALTLSCITHGAGVRGVQTKALLPICLVLLVIFSLGSPRNAQPILEKPVLFSENTDGFTLYHIPSIVLRSKGTVLAYCEARKFSDAVHGDTPH